MWPLFPQRFAAEELPAPPEYRDLLVALLVALLGIAAFVITRLGQKGTAHTLQLVTLRPRHIVTIGEYRVPALHYLLGILFAVLQSALLLLLLAPREAAAGVSGGSGGGDFWVLFGWLSLGVLLLFAVHALLMGWAGYTFAEKSDADLWLANVVILYILFGASLTVPILLLVFSGLPEGVAFGLSAVLYIAFRIWFVVRGLVVLPKLQRAPLLIILYLCACEIAPLYMIPSIALSL